MNVNLNSNAGLSEPIAVRPADEKLISLMRSMVATQNELNAKFSGDDWLDRAAKRTTMDFRFPILDEAAEFIRSDLSWKFWKSNSPPADQSNLKLELIDMLHFLMSEGMACSAVNPTFNGDFDLAQSFVAPEQYTISEDILTEVAKNMWHGYALVAGDPYTGVYDAIRARNGLSHVLSGLFSTFTELRVTAEPGRETLEMVPNPHITWEGFFYAAHHTGMRLEDIFVTYQSKAFLNEFRIRKDDRNGNYSRLWWEKKEDNHYLMEHLHGLVAAGKPVVKDEVLTWLEQAYTRFLGEQV